MDLFFKDVYLYCTFLLTFIWNYQKEKQIFSGPNDSLLPNYIPRGCLALPDFPGLFKKSSLKMADSRGKNSSEGILFRRNIDQYSLGESV